MKKNNKRPGRGRPPGSRNKRTQAMLDAAERSGMLPADLLFAMANGKKTPGIGKPTRAEIIDARKAGAPYFSPRLTAITARVNQPGDPLEELLDLIDGKSRGLPPKNVESDE